MTTKNRPDHYLCWAWLPWHVAELKRQETGGLILPASSGYKGEEEEGALTHFSRLTTEGVISWLWLFDPDEGLGVKEALALKNLPKYCGNFDSAVASLIEATLPARCQDDEINRFMLQSVPVRWLLDLDLSEISEVWVGFDYLKYLAEKKLSAGTQIYGLDEFREYLTSGVA
jgi:hypothetical protein